MMNRLRNSARPASTWLGGTLLRPSALRVSVSTTKILVKLVQSSRIAGATDSTVSAMMMTIDWLGLPLVPLMSTVIEPSFLFFESAGPLGPTGGLGAAAARGTAAAIIDRPVMAVSVRAV